MQTKGTPLHLASCQPLSAIQELWTPLSAGELLSRIGHFLRRVSQMMDEVGYITETLARIHREGNKVKEKSTI